MVSHLLSYCSSLVLLSLEQVGGGLNPGFHCEVAKVLLIEIEIIASRQADCRQ